MINTNKKHDRYRFAAAPCSWGVGNPQCPDSPVWRNLLQEASEAGYSSIELGPYGYFPTDGSMLKDELSLRGMSIISGRVFEPLWDRTRLEETLSKTRKVCQLLHAVGAKQLVIVDAVNDIRERFAGISEQAPRLDKPRWRTMMSTIRCIADIAMYDYGIRAVVHPHAGSYLEFDDEISRMLEDVPYEKAGLCLDTGHFVYAGLEPAQWMKECTFRLEHVHFKDVCSQRLEYCLNSQMVGFRDACDFGVLRSVGEGDIDYCAIKDALDRVQYDGCITLQQLRDPESEITPFEDARRSLNYLRELGF